MTPALPLLATLLQVFAAGDVARCRGAPARQSDAARTAALIPQGATVLMLGDATYDRPARTALQACYGPTWGVHLPRTLAIPGNHDYVSGKAADFLAYFGPAAGERGYFARSLDGWLVIGLDSNQAVAGLDRQYAWLEATLEEHRDVRCTLVMWHAPLFSSGRHRRGGKHMRRFWALLDAHGADVSLHGHEHFYEAFEPLDAAGRPSESGLRSFVVGTGGAKLRGFGRPAEGSRVRIASHGVLRLTLDDGAYEWRFIEVGGQVADSGRARCR